MKCNDMNSIAMDKITENRTNDNLIVLKGISEKNIGKPIVDIEDLISNKRKYLMDISLGNNVISYDEFAFFRNSLLEIYDEIIIINNNLYNNIYPLNAIISEEKLSILKTYFDLEYETESDDFEYIDIVEDYLNIYGHYNIIDEKKYVVYNESILGDDEKVKYINLYKDREELGFENNQKLEGVIEIIEEEDYIRLVSNIDENKKYFIKKLSIDKDIYKDKLEIIKALYENLYITYATVKEEKVIIKKYKEYLKILKNHWKFDQFFDIPFYDINELEKGVKKTIDISQAEIIDSIVLEAEKSMKSEGFRDVFVTAPTGSGKSAMFQIPAIYLGEEHNLMTIVISPLIGLMNDQVKGLEKRNYGHGRTINSDISPIKKQEIMEEIQESKCHILYISPETLLSRSDISQLIGDRRIGLFVIDESHIVTTWGKQFRPDYWFLGDHIKKMRKKQQEDAGHKFPIATFTATAIYGGVEDMYGETKDSLHMPNPITYLGYIKRDNIDIRIKEVEAVRNREEYQLDKFESILRIINKEIFNERKTLVYFPTVRLIDSFMDFAYNNKRGQYIAKYHGQMTKSEKEENYEMFSNNDKNIMIATKAFGMGIDIDDLLTVIHFSPTGNVCDYIQEIGRSARKKDSEGKAYYEYMNNDFKYINRFHGISLIKEYQLIQVIKKIYDLFMSKIENNKTKDHARKQSLLLDAESFSHIFQNDFFDENDAINKVKTAMLIIQKDFEDILGYSPIYMRPIPIFSRGYFYVNDNEKLKEILKRYDGYCEVKDKEKSIIDLNLEYIWEKLYNDAYTFPQFKYLLYSKSKELDFKYKNNLFQALIVDIDFEEGYVEKFNKYINVFEETIYECVRLGKYYSIENLLSYMPKALKVNKYKVNIMIDSFITTMKYYSKEVSTRLHGRMYNIRQNKDQKTSYQFNNKISGYFKWIKTNLAKLEDNIIEGKLYITEEEDNIKEILLFLGLMESFDILTFKSLGGSNSQIYIHINQTQHLKNIINKPYRYKNKILSIVDDRHKVSVQMLKFLFGNEFKSEEIWDYIEDYFLGIVPEEVEESLRLK